MYNFHDIELIEEETQENNNYVYDIQLEDNHYFPANDIISHNCRLLSDMDMLDVASQSNSFGAGGSISLGSHRVVTINFARLAYLATSEKHYYELLHKAIIDTKKILYSHKQLIKRHVEQKLHVFASVGWIDLKRMFSTVGILGVVEAEEILKKRFNTENDNIADTLVFVNEHIINHNQDFPGCIFNIEQIPGESYSHRFPKSEKIVLGVEDYKIYANQLIPLWDHKASIWERIEKDGKYNLMFTGGGIVHINTGEHITGEQAKILIKEAIQSGCEHFAITGTFCKCIKGHTEIGDKNSCSICGEKIVTKIARVVGFFTPVSDWNSVKEEYDHDRRKEYKNGDFNREKNDAECNIIIKDDVILKVS